MKTKQNKNLSNKNNSTMLISNKVLHSHFPAVLSLFWHADKLYGCCLCDGTGESFVLHCSFPKGKTQDRVTDSLIRSSFRKPKTRLLQYNSEVCGNRLIYEYFIYGSHNCQDKAVVFFISSHLNSCLTGQEVLEWHSPPSCSSMPRYLF